MITGGFIADWLSISYRVGALVMAGLTSCGPWGKMLLVGPWSPPVSLDIQKPSRAEMISWLQFWSLISRVSQCISFTFRQNNWIFSPGLHGIVISICHDYKIQFYMLLITYFHKITDSENNNLKENRNMNNVNNLSYDQGFVHVTWHTQLKKIYKSVWGWTSLI